MLIQRDEWISMKSTVDFCDDEKGAYEQEEFWLVVDLWMDHIRRRYVWVLVMLMNHVNSEGLLSELHMVLTTC